MIAIFTDKTVADSYADKIHNYLRSNCPNYQAEKWADPTPNFDNTEWFVKIPVEQGYKTAEEINIVSEVANSKQTKDLPKEGEPIELNEYYLYKGDIFKCVQPHDRTIYDPKDTPALFTGFKAEGDPWIQPTGAQDAYQIGDIVLFEGKNYESTINANVWSPTAYPQGWREV